MERLGQQERDGERIDRRGDDRLAMQDEVPALLAIEPRVEAEIEREDDVLGTERDVRRASGGTEMERPGQAVGRDLVGPGQPGHKFVLHGIEVKQPIVDQAKQLVLVRLVALDEVVTARDHVHLGQIIEIRPLLLGKSLAWPGPVSNRRSREKTDQPQENRLNSTRSGRIARCEESRAFLDLVGRVTGFADAQCIGNPVDVIEPGCNQCDLQNRDIIKPNVAELW